jgi:hypothetical protein
LTHSLLVQEVGNETNGTTQDEKTIENADGQVLLGLLGRERSTLSEQVNEADGNATIDVQDQVVFLRGGDGLNGNSVVKQLVGGEVLEHKVLDQLDAQIGVVARLDSVADTRNCGRLVRLSDMGQPGLAY